MRAVDLFAGAGGFTEGATAAGLTVVWAGNHWPLAVYWHTVNHPKTQHVCQDLHQADWALVPGHDIMLAAPCCQGHANARGKERPHHDRQRSTAWAVVSCAEYHRPSVAVVENVPEFAAWALYPAWHQAMERLGYALTPILVDAADHGVPQHRLRLFIVGVRARHPLQLRLPRRPHVGVGSVIEWDKHRWSPVERPGRSARTLARIAAGRARYGSRFVAPFYGSGSGLTGRSIDRPIGTITTLDRWALVDGDHMRMIQPPELKPIMGFRPDYELPPARRPAIQMLGNAVSPIVATDLLEAIKAAA
ncbi:MAG: DNA cytosine methyltransferase [Ferrovibrionaceae bacterium]